MLEKGDRHKGLGAAVLCVIAGGCVLWTDMGPVEPPDAGVDGDDPVDMVAEGDDPVPDVGDVVEDDVVVDVEAEDVPADVEEEDVVISFDPIPRSSGDLRAVIEALSIPTSTDVVRDPGPGRVGRWTSLVRALLTGDYTEAWNQASFLGVDLSVVDDTVSSRPYLVAHQLGRGEVILVLSPTGARGLVVEVPYPVSANGTLVMGVELLREVNGRVLLSAGGGRCTSTWYTGCDGETVACGVLEPHLTSDVAHYEPLVFHLSHGEVMDHDPGWIAVQLQDQADASGAEAILSDGTDIVDTSTPSLSVALRDAMRTHLSTHSSGIVSCNAMESGSFTSGCNTTNIQGRETNGSSAPCTVAATSSSNRFVALELNGPMRAEAVLPGMTSALIDLF